jgi:adenine deaminase
VEGHINVLCARAAAKGIPVFNILQAACINPVRHYGLDVGLLREGDPADFILVQDLASFAVLETYINGKCVARNGVTGIRSATSDRSPINHFNCTLKTPADFEVPWNGETEIAVIEALDGQLITNKLFQKPMVRNGKVVSDTESDVLKMVVVNRYQEAPAAKAFVKNFGLKAGAIASSVAHDSHNIIAVGVDDESLCETVNSIIKSNGGISISNSGKDQLLPLPVAGLMSTEDGYTVAQQYAALDKAAKELGSTLSAPFMTLSFMALLVIPHLKLSDKGLFDGDSFQLL